MSDDDIFLIEDLDEPGEKSADSGEARERENQEDPGSDDQDAGHRAPTAARAVGPAWRGSSSFGDALNNTPMDSDLMLSNQAQGTLRELTNQDGFRADKAAVGRAVHTAMINEWLQPTP